MDLAHLNPDHQYDEWRSGGPTPPAKIICNAVWENTG